MSSLKDRHVTAACINPFSEGVDVPPNVLMASFCSIFAKAFGVSSLEKLSDPSFEAGFLVEGPKRALQFGNLMMISLSLDQLDTVLDAYLEERGGRASIKKDKTAPDLMFLALGSPIFCHDAVKYALMDRGGSLTEWGGSFIDQIPRLVEDDVVWYDTRYGEKAHKGKLTRLFAAAKASGIIPG